MIEPVTWATEDLQNVMSPKFKEMHKDINSSTRKQFPVPLYAHLPMRELTEDTECKYCKQGCFRCDARKTLSDEEILEVWKENYGDVNILNFARAILKKANEK